MGLWRSTLAHMAGGFALQGGWAVFANMAHPMPAPLIAGLVQGMVSAIVTLGLKHMIEAISARTTGLPGLVLPPLTTCIISVTLLFTIHRLAGTPEVWATLAFPSTIATLYAALYTFRLRSHQ
ncbi:hypothetical protein E2K80_17310 [Rhodophyticola sp. CCM32]|uniref:hypothetical protein n=1 Tax=Rhodophyticola sp. CCM32 TaxID=2916397 RepID=UPI00107F8FC6|nr:hypothetical protein [Rhodophyticola sp. CCM32]QBY02279.1 hypothetical protein E2K80_17310 [Rhodophyticola sp. CCM32]